MYNVIGIHKRTKEKIIIEPHMTEANAMKMCEAWGWMYDDGTDDGNNDGTDDGNDNTDDNFEFSDDAASGTGGIQLPLIPAPPASTEPETDGEAGE